MGVVLDSEELIVDSVLMSSFSGSGGKIGAVAIEEEVDAKLFMCRFGFVALFTGGLGPPELDLE
jgi:hypothetical protein